MSFFIVIPVLTTQSNEATMLAGVAQVDIAINPVVVASSYVYLNARMFALGTQPECTVRFLNATTIRLQRLNVANDITVQWTVVAGFKV